MYLRMGNLGTQLISNPTPEWRTFLDGKLVAVLEKQAWVNDDVEFNSKEAGEILLDTYKTVFAAQVKDGPIEEKEDDDAPKSEDKDVKEVKEDNKPHVQVTEEVIKDTPNNEPSMVKNDEGVVKDVPPGQSALPDTDPDDSGCCGNCADPAAPHEPCDTSEGNDNPAKFSDIIHQLIELVESLDKGGDKAEGFPKMDALATQFHVEKLLVTAERELAEGLDCTATLDELDKFALSVSPLKDDPQVTRAESDLLKANPEGKVAPVPPTMNDINDKEEATLGKNIDTRALLQAADSLAAKGIDVTDVIEQIANMPIDFSKVPRVPTVPVGTNGGNLGTNTMNINYRDFANHVNREGDAEQEMYNNTHPAGSNCADRTCPWHGDE